MLMTTMPNKLDVHFSSGNEFWETPDDLYARLDREFSFGCDAAAIEKNAKHTTFITPEMDAFKVPWTAYSGGAPVWLNPPYGRRGANWVLRAWEEAHENKIDVVCLLPARTDTVWFHDICMLGEVRLLRGRVHFLEDGDPVEAAPFPSMIVVFGPSIPPSVRSWDWRREW